MEGGCHAGLECRAEGNGVASSATAVLYRPGKTHNTFFGRGLTAQPDPIHFLPEAYAKLMQNAGQSKVLLLAVWLQGSYAFDLPTKPC